MWNQICWLLPAITLTVTFTCPALDGAQPREKPASHPAMGEFEVIRQDPDPAVVRDPAALAALKQTGLPWRIRHTKSGVYLLLVPPGSFQMGSPGPHLVREVTPAIPAAVDASGNRIPGRPEQPAVHADGEQGRESDEHSHRVEIRSPFYLAETEVTCDQWSAVIHVSKSVGALPITSVSNDDCTAFCTQTGLRLPTEEEWEFACRAGTSTAFNWGDDRAIPTSVAIYDQELESLPHVADPGVMALGQGLEALSRLGKAMGEYPFADPSVLKAAIRARLEEEWAVRDREFAARYHAIKSRNDARRPEPREVRTTARNPWGFFEMHGNVCELCAGEYALYPGAPKPEKAIDPNQCTFRGGCWRDKIDDLRSAARMPAAWLGGGKSEGFRPAMDAAGLPR